MSRLRARGADERGLAGAILLGVVVWAVTALGLLIGILGTSAKLNKNVKIITHEVGGIDHDADDVALVVEINRTAAAILDAARPLPGHLERIQASAANIDRNVGDVKGTVTEINGTAKAISGTAGSIGKTVDSIKGTLAATGKTAEEINGRVKSIFGDVETAANGAKAIESGLASAIGRIDAFIGVLDTIKGDIANILTLVGPDHLGADGKKTIHGHANSIECSDLVRTLRVGAALRSGPVNQACAG